MSRSFAAVIQQLPEELTDAVCIFYLVLRALDSVEDDTSFPLDKRIPLLRVFHEKLEEPEWSIEGVGDAPDYRVLLKHFPKVTRFYGRLDEGYRLVISDITRRMGNGMADFAKMQTVDSVKDYDKYCHYVAGLVGYGLSDLFSASGREEESLRRELRLSNSCGLSLQKTNIIRDYAEDLDEGRIWWPKEVWQKYGATLGWFHNHPDDPRSLALLNHMVTNALQHVPDVLEYLGRLKDPKVFRFCAIPQVMAIATLEKVYNNADVFRTNVKIRKGLACQLMLNTNTMDDVHAVFHRFATRIARRVPARDPNAEVTLAHVNRICSKTGAPIPRTLLRAASTLAWLVLLLVSAYLFSEHGSSGRRLQAAAAGEGLSAPDFAAIIAAFCSIGYLLGFSGMHYV